MGRWVETSTYWQGDLLHFERRPFKGWCVEGKREVGGTTRIVRIVADPIQRLAGGAWDFDFLRVFALTALIMSTFLVMVALTPKPKLTMLVVEEPLHDLELRHAILAGRADDGWGARPAVAPKLASNLIPGPTRIVIPTPPGSRVRPAEPELVRDAGILAMLRTRDGEELTNIFGADTAAIYGVGGLGLRSDTILSTVEGGVEGGVVGGIIGYKGDDEVGGVMVGVGWGTIGTAADKRCGPLVDHLVSRIFESETQRAFARRMCGRASTQALDCLERAMSGDSITAAGIVAQCGTDLPPPLTRRLQRLHR